MKYYLTLFLSVFFCLSASADSLVALRTLRGTVIYGFTRDAEHPDVNAVNTYFTSRYPNAVMISSATTSYNCHSYAWNMSEGGPTCWLNANDGLAYHWADGSYIETLSDVEKIYYYDGDHSAVKSKYYPGKYESKWGAAPLMRHDPEYGPAEYNMSRRRFYKKNLEISGPLIIGGTNSATYSVPFIPYGMSLSLTFTGTGASLLSSSPTSIEIAPATATTTGDITVLANYVDSAGNIRFSYRRDVGINGPHYNQVGLVVRKSSDGTEVYPSGEGLRPNTFYRAYLSCGTATLQDVVWSPDSRIEIVSSDNQMMYFRTFDIGFCFLDIYAKIAPYNISKKVISTTLY